MTDFGVIHKDLLKKVLEIAFFAARVGRHTQAQAIFMSVSVMHKDMKVPLVGLAFNWMMQQDYDAAVLFLEDLMQKGFSEDEEIKVMYGLALKHASHSNQADRILGELSEHAHDEKVKALARSGHLASL